MVSGWMKGADLVEPTHYSSALPPGITGRYRVAVQAAAQPLEGAPSLYLDYHVVGVPPGSAGSFIASAVLKYGTILEVYAGTTHTVIVVEEMDFIDGRLSRETDPMIRIRMRDNAYASAPFPQPGVNMRLKGEVRHVIAS